jgi:cation:H+ antiporter
MLNNLYVNILGFAISAVVIIYSGTKLSFYGDKIGDLTGMGKAWVGLILMASVTSLPELMTGISSVAIVKEPDLAAGDIFGSCVFNLLILSVLDARIKQPLFSTVKSSHIVAAIFGIILLTVAGIAIYLSHEIPSVLWMSSFSFALFGIYLVSVWGIFKYEHITLVESQPESHPHSAYRSADLKKAIRGYVFNALIVIGAAIFLPYFGEHITAQTGLGKTFFGTLVAKEKIKPLKLIINSCAYHDVNIEQSSQNRRYSHLAVKAKTSYLESI